MGWYEAIKDAISVADRLRDAELKQKLADIQMECAKLAEENARLRQERNELKKQIEAREHLEFRQNVYWRKTGEGKDEGPFCPSCADGGRKIVRMEDRPDDRYWRCTVCQHCTEKPGYHDRVWRP
jgi:FtsZ-binding cell division protein ZapB